MIDHRKFYGIIAVGPVFILTILISSLGLELTYNQYAVDALWPHALSFDYAAARDNILLLNSIATLITFSGFLIWTKFKYANNGKVTRLVFLFALISLQFFFCSTLFDLNEREIG